MTKDRTEEQPEISGGRAFPEEGEPCRRPGSGQWKQFRTAMKDLKRKNEEGSPAGSREAGTEQAEDTERPVCRKDRKKCSILFTSFGKRAYLPQIFAEAMDRLGLHGTIYAGDCTGRIACPAAVVPVKLPPILESGGGRKEEGGSGRIGSRWRPLSLQKAQPVRTGHPESRRSATCSFSLPSPAPTGSTLSSR